MRAALLIGGLLQGVVVFGAETSVAPEAVFAETRCQQCHRQRDPGLVAEWQASGHGARGCIACHGPRHGDAGSTARRVSACIACHSGAAAKSYANSKHGIIERLQGGQWDWSQRLAPASYRAPSCAYCHLPDGEHDTRPDSQPPPDTICVGCHAPRYVRRYLDSGRRMIEIGRMKVREAQALAAEMEAADDSTPVLDEHLGRMAGETLRNLRLGVGHQSPEYQWWLGQPALDGDLVRIQGERIKRSAAGTAVRSRIESDDGR